jgi:BirA family biotin operon repressor/biotin-[acetyl-CoA-carboxylase] ligase
MRRRGDLFAPAMVLTGRQTAGRGRGQNVWWSGPGCLTVTFVLPADGHVAPHQLPLVAGLAVRNAAAEVTGNGGIQLKWPNDVLFDLRKLAGLLCERVQGADLVGLGLNVNLDPAGAPPALRGRVTSLSAVAGRPLDMTTVLSVVAGHLHRAVSRRAEEPFAAVLREYDSHHALVGKTVTVATGDSEPRVSGRCQGLDEIGRLVLRSRGKLHRVISGQVTLG